jgi:hypothetical protein
MKFIKLESRGGNYLVVASNVAWLRTAENGQTSVGIIGGQPLLVVGSVEEVADKILAGMAEAAAESATPPDAASAAPSAPAPAPTPAPPAAVEPEPEPVTAQAAEPEAHPEPEPEPDLPVAPLNAPVAVKPAAARPRAVSARSASMWERPATPPKVKASSQRMMGGFE